MMRYPIGVQSFEEIRQQGYVYVDKTELLYKLVDQGKYFFFSRPRRFGKSLTMSTLKAIFQAKQELFAGLWIDGKHDFSQVHPVIHLEFNQLGHKELGLEKALSLRMDKVAKDFGVAFPSGLSPGLKLEELVN